MFTRQHDGVVEEPLRLEGAAGSLHAMLHLPRSGAVRGGVVVAAPDGEERAWAERSLVVTARGLADQGFAVLRFDFGGQGESDGDYERTTMATRIADLRAAVEALRQRIGRSPLVLGVRLGGAVTLAAAAAGDDVHDVVLWEPTLAPGQYVHQLLRVNVSTQMVAHGQVLKDRDRLIADARGGALISVNGYNLTGAFIDELLTLDVLSTLRARTGRTLVLANGPVNSELAGQPGVDTERISCPPFWTEPKLHVASPPPFLTRTIAWLSGPVGRAA